MNQAVQMGKSAIDAMKRPTRIAGAVITMSFIFLLVLYLKPPTADIDLSFGQIFKEFISLIALCVGYIFGSASKG